MFEKANGGYGVMQIHHLNGKLFKKILKAEPEAHYHSEQGKILIQLWLHDGSQTATDIALASGLANNTLTVMLKHMEEQGLVSICPHKKDKRKKVISLTELGWQQKEIGIRVSNRLGDIFYQGFSNQEINEFESYQNRILENLKKADKKVRL